ncbi:hypothetical protein EDB80DRAFT_784020 [Ilyonectria destructans]|nr:hypothetical protein EDB80DRAFT_784020 [Ilyonectria destructans]
MLLKHLLELSALLVGSWAQTTTQAVGEAATETPSSTLEESATTTATGTGVTTHTINVGAAGHKFTPDETEADIGDIIEYRFYPDAHWVIRGDFENPCIPYEYVQTDRQGFSSGRQPVKAITDDAPRFRVRVNNTEPIFYYCGAPGSCVKYHMMGVVNPSKNQTLDAWLEKAEYVEYQLTPGEPFPTEEGFPTSTTSAIPDSTGGPSIHGDDHRGHGHGLSPGAIAGIVIGSVAVLIPAVGAIYLSGRRGGFDKAYHNLSFHSTVPIYPKGGPPFVEAQFGSPNAAAVGIWANKQPTPMANSGQIPPISPQFTPGYNFPQGARMMSQDRNSPNTH